MFKGFVICNKNSLEYLKKLRGLETKHLNYSIKYLYSLVNSGNFKEAFNYSKKLEKQKKDNFESHLISGIFHLKNALRNNFNEHVSFKKLFPSVMMRSSVKNIISEFQNPYT